MKTCALAFTLLLGALPAFSQGKFQQTALGDFPLENGQVIKNCHLGYRTFGRMNSDTSNVVVLLPWYSGRSEHFAFALGPESMVDSNRYFVIIIDPFGDGVSISPSNSVDQPEAAFPNFGIW